MAKDDAEKEGEAAKGGGAKKLIVILVPVILLLAGAGWFFFLRGDDSGAPTTLPHPEPGPVVKLEPITINLAQSHFLKIGMALQPTASAHELDGSKALDLAISQFSQNTIEELSTAEGRTKAKEELVARVKLAYLPHGTDLATATAGASTAKSTEKPSTETGTEKTSTGKSAETPSTEKTTGTAGEHGTETGTGTGAAHETDADHEIAIADLSGEEALKLSAALTVQPDVYDIYFTEFVMQ